LYGAGSSVAAGDVLVTIKAKYESVDAALKSLKNVDKAIVSINKKKIAIDTSGTTRALRTVEDGLEKVSRAASLVGDKALGVRQLRNDLNLLGNQLADAQAKFRGTTDETKRGAAAATILAGRYKQMRLELAAFAKARRDDKKGEDLFGRRGKDASYGPFGDIKKQITELKALPKTLADTTGALGQINFALDNATVTSKEFKELAKAQNYFLEQQASIQAAINQTTEKRVVAEQKVTAAVKETVAAKKADPGAGSKAYFPPGVLKIPGAQSMLDKQGAGSLERAIQMAFRAQEAAGGAKYPAARALEDLLGPSGLDKVMTKIRAFGGSLDLATTDVKRFGTSFPGGTLNIPGAQKMLREQGPGSLQSAINLSRTVQAETGMPAAEALRLMLDDLTYFGQKLKELGWSANKVDDAFVKIARASTGARAGGGGGGRRRGVAERFEAIHGRPLPEGYGSRGFRNTRRGMRRAFGGKTAQNFLLGGGFPMLFGGGAGAVGGSLAGSGMAAMMGMPGAGFGLQIMGSALGTMFEKSISQVNELRKAMDSLNMDKLIDGGIRFNGMLQSQVNALKEQGRHAEAKVLLEKELFKQTGATAGVYETIGDSVNLLSAAWDEVRNSVSATGGYLASPFMVALAAILKLVALIIKGVNTIISAFDLGLKTLGKLFPQELQDGIKNAMESLNRGLQDGRANAEAIVREINKIGRKDQYSLNRFESMIDVPKTRKDRRWNFDLEQQNQVEALGDRRLEAWKAARAQINPFTSPAQTRKIMTGFENEWGQANYDSSGRLLNRATLDPNTSEVFGGTEGRRGQIDLDRKRKQFVFQEDQREMKSKHRLELSNEQLKIDEKVFELQKQSNSMFGQSNDQQIKRLALKQKELAENKKLKEIEFKYGKESNEYKIQANELLKAQLELQYHLSDEQIRQAQLWRQVGDAIQNSVVSAIEAAITKAQSFADIMSSLLMSVGRMFLNAGVSGLMSNINFGGGNPNKAKVSDYMEGFASGGYVNSPTNALIGEGGEGEYVIPESQMSDAMSRYSGGARGDAVLAGGGGDGEAGGISGGASGSIDVTFNTQVINDVSYVSYSEFEAGVTAAARQGAKQGEMATLRRLQTNPSSRRRLGI